MSFNPANLKNYRLYQLFWETPEPQAGQEDDGLSHRGLAQVNPAGAERLRQAALQLEADGTPSADGEQKIDPTERELMIYLLQHEDYGPAFGPEARPKIYADFGIDPGAIHPTTDAHRPQKAGTISLPEKVSKYSASQLSSIDPEKLPEMMSKEFASRKSELASSSLSSEERGTVAVGLLRDYAAALWSRGEGARTEQIGNKLLDAFEAFGADAIATGSKDYSGVGFGIAQSLVLRAKPDQFDTFFPDAKLEAKTTSLSMNGAMAEPMKHMDAVRKAMGLEPGAEALELASPVGWMLGQINGHKKRGNLTESKAFSTSGLNWGTLMFPGDKKVAGLPPKEGFDFPIDCIDSLGNMISARAGSDKLVVFDKEGAELVMKAVIHEDADGKPESWSATFENAQGQEVPIADVGMGRIKTSSGQFKGDGQTTESINMWWWGFCDRNTAQKLYKSKFDIPELDRETIKIKAGDEIISVPRSAAQQIIDADIPSIVTGDNFTGFRFNNEPQYVILKNGQQIQGYVEGLALEAGPGVTRLQQDLLAVHDAPGRPMLGFVEVGSEVVDVRNIDRIEKGEDGNVTVFKKEGYPESVSGKLETKLKWEQAEEVDGKTVLKQTEDFQIRGGFKVKTGGGVQRFSASEISMIAGETTKDMRISQFMTWVSNNKGMYAQDASPKEVVSNGPRWVNKLDIREETGEERPSFIPSGDLSGVNGTLAREEGDKMLYVRGLYAYGGGSDPSSSQFDGWIQVNKSGRIINEGFTNGQPDFGWSADGPLNWLAKSTFNDQVVPEARLAMFVNGVSNLSDSEAERLNLPSNWKSYLVPQD